MIALTQEKREELANYARARLASHVVHGGCSDEEDIFKIALASLTTAAVLHAVDSDVEDKIYTALCNEHEVGAYPLFTSPPVPEIKFPSAELIKEVFLANGFKEKVQIDGRSDLNSYVYEAALELIERLNGLGE
ncbi:hypothetical protein [Rosenbergiella epipactidis]|uniref:hypothetical protein n=1 Tax=Rosenbergiella epipactidis TaxID=1544694 RepID=UPI001F4DAB18|nr:hypothetical protein [Rosenbergiella epipactidis]